MPCQPGTATEIPSFAPVVMPMDGDEILVAGDWPSAVSLYPVDGIEDVLIDDKYMVLLVRDLQ